MAKSYLLKYLLKWFILKLFIWKLVKASSIFFVHKQKQKYAKGLHKVPQGPMLVAFVTVISNLFSLIWENSSALLKHYSVWCSALLKVNGASVIDFNTEWTWPNSLWPRLLAIWAVRCPVDGYLSRHSRPQRLPFLLFSIKNYEL